MSKIKIILGLVIAVPLSLIVSHIILSVMGAVISLPIFLLWAVVSVFQ